MLRYCCVLGIVYLYIKYILYVVCVYRFYLIMYMWIKLFILIIYDVDFLMIKWLLKVKMYEKDFVCDSWILICIGSGVIIF